MTSSITLIGCEALLRCLEDVPHAFIFIFRSQLFKKKTCSMNRNNLIEV